MNLNIGLHAGTVDEIMQAGLQLDHELHQYYFIMIYMDISLH